MQATETIPLFKTRSTGAGAVAATNTDPAALPPMRMVSSRPALPRSMWLAGLSFADALAAHTRLKANYFCTLGHDAGGYFVRCDPAHYEVVTP